MTKEHAVLTSRALNWLWNRATGSGIRAAREIWTGAYRADAVALAQFQWRFRDRLCWENEIYGLWAREIERATLYKPLAMVFETKVSRSDFGKMFGARGYGERGRARPSGNLHFVVMPKGLVPLDRVPEMWGVLEPYGSGITLKRWPRLIALDNGAVERIAYQILWAGINTRWR